MWAHAPSRRNCSHEALADSERCARWPPLCEPRDVRGRFPAIGEDRTFRLDRITDARTLPGSFEPPADLDPARPVGLATAPYRHEAAVCVQGTAEHIRS